jgi:hypothetical protein
LGPAGPLGYEILKDFIGQILYTGYVAVVYDT